MPDDDAKSLYSVSDKRFARFTNDFGISELNQRATDYT